MGMPAGLEYHDPADELEMCKEPACSKLTYYLVQGLCVECWDEIFEEERA